MHRMDKATVNKIGPMLNIKEVSRLLHVHPDTLRRWSNQGILKAYRIGSRGDRRFRREDIKGFLSELASDSIGEEKPSLTRQILGDNKL